MSCSQQVATGAPVLASPLVLELDLGAPLSSARVLVPSLVLGLPSSVTAAVSVPGRSVVEPVVDWPNSGLSVEQPPSVNASQLQTARIKT